MSDKYLEKYKNPENPEEILSKLRECSSLEDIKKLIYGIFPDLVKEYTRGYSSDYPYLIITWYTLCKAIKTEPKGIILVEFVPPSIKDDISEEYSVLRKFLDVMTANGFVARRNEEFMLCNKCGLAIPRHNLYKYVKFRFPDKFPDKWDIKCSECEVYVQEHKLQETNI